MRDRKDWVSVFSIFALSSTLPANAAACRRALRDARPAGADFPESPGGVLRVLEEEPVLHANLAGGQIVDRDTVLLQFGPGNDQAVVMLLAKP